MLRCMGRRNETRSRSPDRDHPSDRDARRAVASPPQKTRSPFVAIHLQNVLRLGGAEEVSVGATAPN
jgi:hypothetical protein